MKSFKQYTQYQESFVENAIAEATQRFLLEDSTADATNAEMAICLAYNMKRIQDADPERYRDNLPDLFAQGLAEAAIAPAKWNAVGNKEELLEIGNKVVKGLGDRGAFLIHAGTSSEAKTHYTDWGGSDTTSKSDLYGSNKNSQNISLKKQGDKGQGAQLMSAKSGEAAGVFHSAMEHHKNVDGKDISKNPDFLAAMKILEVDMDKTSTNRLNVEVGAGKKDFGTWYVESSKRAKHLRQKYKGDKKTKDSDITNFLKGELSLVGAAVKVLAKDKDYVKKLPKETPLKNKKALDPHIDEYVKATSWDVGGAPSGRKDKDKGIKVSAYHFFKGGKTGKSTDWAAGVDAKVFKSKALKSQVRDIIHIAIDNKAWQEKLTKFFTNNEPLKKWMVYEAASGLYKFTGDASSGQAYPGTQREVANKILVFSDSGYETEYKNLVTYAGNNTNLVDNISVTFKGTGRSKEAVVRIATNSYEPKGELPLLEEILNEETPRLLQEIYQIERSYLLSEGIFRNAVDKVKKFASHVTNLLKTFYENVIKKFMTKLLELAKEGVTKFLEALGLEAEGEVSMATPSW